MTLDLAGRRVSIVGAGGRTGHSMMLALDRLGARVTALDDADGSTAAGLPGDTELVLVTSGLRPTHPLVLQAAGRGLPVWGDAELAWRINAERPEPARWLVITGTNGKTTTTELLAAVLEEAGRDVVACGNIGLPVLDAVLREPAPDVLAVELSSFQLHWAPSVRPLAGAVLNVAPDHLDWHGSMSAYADAKLRALGDASTVAIGVAGAAGSVELVRRALGRQVLVTLEAPGADQLGIVRQEGGPPLLVDRAFAPGAPAHAEALAALDELPKITAAHELTNALAAAALARAAGVSAAAVASGLAAHTPGAHRRQHVRTLAGVDWVNDSKATNPHAAIASITAFDRVVWIAGGLNKDLSFDALVRQARPVLAAAILLGRCAPELADALARHAPSVPLITVDSLEAAVGEAATRAREGETVLLAPAAASQDMFRDYGERGDRFVAAVLALNPTPPPPPS